eukprot:6186647-Pleurochrysis_carterae.AAC.4
MSGILRLARINVSSTAHLRKRLRAASVRRQAGASRRGRGWRRGTRRLAAGRRRARRSARGEPSRGPAHKITK